ncbi:MAG TPA: hypothetical protein VFV88_03820 [Steroidobacteraceae bacterium]|nr:hypothetical protein [Steroidobacteraceae bacterium]
MRTPRRLAVVTLLAACAGWPAWSADPTTPEVKAEIIRLVDTLEKQPGHPDARAMRASVLKWLTDAPDVSVKVCFDFLGMEDFAPDGREAELFFQQPFAEARYVLENPDKAKDEIAVHLAGVESALRTYAVMKAEDAKLEIPAMEKLVKLQAEQKLPEHVSKATKKCH